MSSVSTFNLIYSKISKRHKLFKTVTVTKLEQSASNSSGLSLIGGYQPEVGWMLVYDADPHACMEKGAGTDDL